MHAEREREQAQKSHGTYKPTSRLICLFFNSFCAVFYVSLSIFHTSRSLSLFGPRTSAHHHICIHHTNMHACMNARALANISLCQFSVSIIFVQVSGQNAIHGVIFISFGSTLRMNVLLLLLLFLFLLLLLYTIYDCLYLFFVLKRKKWIKSKNHPKYLLFLSEPLKINDEERYIEVRGKKQQQKTRRRKKKKRKTMTTNQENH